MSHHFSNLSRGKITRKRHNKAKANLVIRNHVLQLQIPIKVHEAIIKLKSQIRLNCLLKYNRHLSQRLKNAIDSEIQVTSTYLGFALQFMTDNIKELRQRAYKNLQKDVKQRGH